MRAYDRVLVLGRDDLTESGLGKWVYDLTIQDFKVPHRKFQMANLILFIYDDRTKVLKCRYKDPARSPEMPEEIKENIPCGTNG